MLPKILLFAASRFWLQTVIENVRGGSVPVVPSYGSPDEYSLQQRQLTYQPTMGTWPPAAPRGLRPIGGNPFGARTPGYRIGGGVGGYSDILAAQRLWSSFVSGLNGGR